MFIKKSITILITSLVAYYFLYTLIKLFYTDLLILPLIVLLIIIAYKTPVLYLIAIITFNEKFFQMINIWGVKAWMYRDYTILFLCAGIIVQLIKNRFRLKLGTNNYYFRYILLIFAVIFLSISFGSYLMLGQNLNSLIFRARPYFLYLIFLYLCLAEFNIDQIDKSILFIIFSGVIVSTLLIIDAKLLGGFVIFKNAWTTGIGLEREGNVRIVVYQFMIIFTYFYLLSTIKFNKNSMIRLLSILSIAIIAYQTGFVGMTRQVLLIVFMTTILFLVNIKSLISKTFIYCTLSLALLAIVTFFLINPLLMEQSFFYKIYERSRVEATSEEEGNIAVRIKGIKFYYPYFQKTAFLGMGMTSVTEENSPEYIGFKEGYMFTDLGFFAIFYRFGILSLILIAVILTRIFKDLSFIQKNGDMRCKIIANSLTYLFISSIIFLPALKGFFDEGHCLYYGTFFYIIYKLKSEIPLQDSKSCEALIHA